MSVTVLQSMFRHKTWADSELLAVLASHPAERTRKLDSCLSTLNHVLVVDRIFRAHLCGDPRPFDATNTTDIPDIDRLRSAFAEIDAWYETFAGNTNAEALSSVVAFEFTSGNRGRMSREEILMHVLTHGIFHRGEIAQVLKSNAVTPPDDPYTVFLHQTEPDRRQP